MENFLHIALSFVIRNILQMKIKIEVFELNELKIFLKRKFDLKIVEKFNFFMMKTFFLFVNLFGCGKNKKF